MRSCPHRPSRATHHQKGDSQPWCVSSLLLHVAARNHSPSRLSSFISAGKQQPGGCAPRPQTPMLKFWSRAPPTWGNAASVRPRAQAIRRKRVRWWPGDALRGTVVYSLTHLGMRILSNLTIPLLGRCPTEILEQVCCRRWHSRNS